DLREDNWGNAAEAIMTTDTVPKARARRAGPATVTGIAKGAGMIRPDMATMLGFVATDAALSQAALERLVGDAAAGSVNRISVDGDTSTNDSFILIATGAAGRCDHALLRDAVLDVSQRLAQAIVRDGEGATKFISVRVEKGRDAEECAKVAYAIAHSPL